MRSLSAIVLLFLSGYVLAFGDYPDEFSMPINDLGFGEEDIRAAAKHTLMSRHWRLESESPGATIANLHDGHLRVRIDYSVPGKLVVKYISRSDNAQEYRTFRRLNTLFSTLVKDLADCKLTKKSTDPGANLRRNLVHALNRYKWQIQSISASKMVAAQSPYGRVEVILNGADGVSFKRWDAIEEEYTNSERDRYLQRIQGLFEHRQMLCK